MITEHYVEVAMSVVILPYSVKYLATGVYSPILEEMAFLEVVRIDFGSVI